MNILFYILTFLFISIGVMGLLTLTVGSGSEQRIRELVQPAEKNDWMQTVVQIVGPFAKLSAPDVTWETSPLRLRFINAGIRSERAPLIYFGLKSLLPLVFAGATFLGLQISGISMDRTTLAFVLLVVATVGCYLPNIVIWRITAYRKREILENFPDATDLMLVCVEAGLGLDSALTKVAEELQLSSVVLAQEIHLTNLEIRAGRTRDHALHNLGLRSGLDEINTFAAMLAQSDKFGTSVGESLRVFSDDLRHKRQIRAEEMAAKIGTKMLFPLVFCIFPAISMVILGPAAIRIWNSILPMLSGQGTP